MPLDQKKKILDIYTLGDLIDRAIIYLTANNEITTLGLQKGIFLYLYSYAVTNGYDFNKVLESAAFEPYRFGPFSDEVLGQAETLAGYGTITGNGTGEKRTFTGTAQNVEKISFGKSEVRLLENIKNLVKTLESLELTFYIYFNPLIDEGLREHFTSKSEIKESLIRHKETFIRSLLRKGIIDENTADLITYGNS